MGNSQSITMLTCGVDDTVLPSDPVNVHFRNFIENLMMGYMYKMRNM